MTKAERLSVLITRDMVNGVASLTRDEHDEMLVLRLQVLGPNELTTAEANAARALVAAKRAGKGKR